MDFPVGSRLLHKDENFNYQLNRLALWGGGDFDELAQVAPRIHDAADWERELLALGEKALAEDRLVNAAGYFRMAEFFMYDGNPQKLAIFEKAKQLFDQANAAVFAGGEVTRYRVPYLNTTLPVWVCLPERAAKDTIVLFGGFDSYIEEFMSVARYLAKNDYAVYLFEGPGQGEVLRVGNLKFTPEWHKPIAAVLDYFDLKNVSLIGISLGGMLAPRAAAYEKRIRRVIGLSILPSLFDVFFSRKNKALKGAVNLMQNLKMKRLLNMLVRLKLASTPMIEWQINHAMYAFGADNAYDLFRVARQFQIADIGEKIEQDFLLIGAREDHLIPASLYKDEIDALTNVRSLTFRLFTEHENAGTHCSAGNVKLVLDFIDWWIGSVS